MQLSQRLHLIIYLPALCTSKGINLQQLHVLSACLCRYDTYQGSLSTPGVVALLTAWGQQLQQLFDSAVATQNMQLQHQQEQQQGPNSLQRPLCGAMLRLSSFLEFLQERATIPQLLEPADVQEVLKRLIAQQPDAVSA